MSHTTHDVFMCQDATHINLETFDYNEKQANTKRIICFQNIGYANYIKQFDKDINMKVYINRNICTMIPKSTCHDLLKTCDFDKEKQCLMSFSMNMYNLLNVFIHNCNSTWNEKFCQFVSDLAKEKPLVICALYKDLDDKEKLNKFFEKESLENSDVTHGFKSTIYYSKRLSKFKCFNIKSCKTDIEKLVFDFEQKFNIKKITSNVMHESKNDEIKKDESNKNKYKIIRPCRNKPRNIFKPHEGGTLKYKEVEKRKTWGESELLRRASKRPKQITEMEKILTELFNSYLHIKLKSKFDSKIITIEDYKFNISTFIVDFIDDVQSSNFEIVDVRISDVLKDGWTYLRAKLYKSFPISGKDVLFQGYITSYNESLNEWGIRYEDNDEEILGITDFIDLLNTKETNESLYKEQKLQEALIHTVD